MTLFRKRHSDLAGIRSYRKSTLQRRLASTLLLFLLHATTEPAASQSKKALDHDAYEIWNEIDGETISDDGRWVAYSAGPENQDGRLFIYGLKKAKRYVFARGESPQFNAGGSHLAFKIVPPKDSVRKAKLDRLPERKMPKDSLAILRLDNGRLDLIDRLKSFSFPDKDGTHLAFLVEPPDADSLDASADSTPADSSDCKKETEPEGAPLILRSLDNGSERQFDNVTEYRFSKRGRWLAFATSSEEGGDDGLYVLNTTTDSLLELAAGPGIYKNITLDEDEEQVAFLSNRMDAEADQPSYALYHWRVGMDSAVVVADASTKGIPHLWWIGPDGKPEFSKDGSRLYFGTAPRPEPDCEPPSLPDDEKVVVDVWSWTDDTFYLEQVAQIEEEKKRTYKAVVHLDDHRVVQLATESVPEITVGMEGNAPVAIANTSVPYRQEISWDYPDYHDVYLIDVATGESRIILERIQSHASLSPAARYVTWWVRDSLAWFGIPVAGGDVVNLTSDLPYPVHNERHDLAYLPNPYGTAGWTDSDQHFLVYDRFDLWAIDPSRSSPPRCITEGSGRSNQLRYRYVKLDPDQTSLDPSESLLFSTFHYRTRAAGFATDRIDGTRAPRTLVLDEMQYSLPKKARNSDTILFTRGSFLDFPDLWTSDVMFKKLRRVSFVNPQQNDYRWGNVELVHWTSTNGLLLDGLLYKPEDFDPNGSYPLMVYFYEKNSDNLHRHIMPAPHRSIINITFYVSRGYVVFVPDIPYRIGYPGESAENAVLPGVTNILSQGFIDPDRIGVQGHSWGGYQIAHLVTKTNMFRAAEAGAPVSNMVSAYGGIRWKTGKSRMFQYERTQSRIGGSLWEYPLRFLDNSPIFRADKIETPLLIMHNDHDGAVPWTQGIELFVALRRLGKPVWLINYNDEPHWPTKYQNKRDWTIRMQQYFDHYLMDAPAPRWMTEGVPAVEKGKTLGLEYETMSDER